MSDTQMTQQERGANIKKMRVQRGLSARELGGIVGVSRQRIGHVESGMHDIQLGTLSKVATALKVEMRDLLDPELNTRIECFTPFEEDGQE